jgi:hypothetical protein
MERIEEEEVQQKEIDEMVSISLLRSTTMSMKVVHRHDWWNLRETENHLGR